MTPMVQGFLLAASKSLPPLRVGSGDALDATDRADVDGSGFRWLLTEIRAGRARRALGVVDRDRGGSLALWLAGARCRWLEVESQH